jgi:hypothetical protein
VDKFVTKLEDLPAFEVESIEATAGDPRLVGRFNHLRGVRECRSWLYAGLKSLIGDVEGIERSSRRAVFIAPFWTPECPVQLGTVAPWIDGAWQAYQVVMIVGPTSWRRQEFVPSDAQHFVRGTAHGWTKAGARLDEDRQPTFIEAGGWDHEECDLCQAHIGRGGLPYGYVHSDGTWLCDSCYRRYAEPRDLSFLVAT